MKKTATKATRKTNSEAQSVEVTGRCIQLTVALPELLHEELMIDGLHVDDHVVLVALGFDLTGAKHLLGIHEGATENRESCKALLANLVERGIDSGRSTLFVLDGATISPNYQDHRLLQVYDRDRSTLHPRVRVRLDI